MSKNKKRLMLSVNDLIDEIAENSDKIFKNENSTKFAYIHAQRKNIIRLGIIIPESYWVDSSIGNRLRKRLEDNSELSNLLTATDGHSGVKGTRQDLASDLAGEHFSCLEKHMKDFEDIFSYEIVKETFSVRDVLPNVFEYLTQDLSLKKNKAPYSKVKDFIHELDGLHKTLLYLAAYKKYSSFFRWLFLYCLMQEEIISFKAKMPEIQYHKVMKYLVGSKGKYPTFVNDHMISVYDENDFWELRRQVVRTARGHLMISGPSLKNAFNMGNSDTLVNELKEAIGSGAITKVSIMITDPVIFEKQTNCGDPVRDISDTMGSLEERFYPLFEEKKIRLKIYFLPLLQIDHAVITEEFMIFRSYKLWNRERKFKGILCLHLADCFTTGPSEYRAQKEYLTTIAENSTDIDPEVDVDRSVLDQTTVRSRHMHWRNFLKKNRYKYVTLHKVYEKQVFNYVSSTWSSGNPMIGSTVCSSTILHPKDLFEPANLLNDPSQRILLPYIQETQRLFDKAIHKHDKNGFSNVFPSLDLGFPNNVQRLAGGFATGMLVTWQCGVDIIPIDATVNVCTSSVFKIKNFNPDCLADKKKYIKELKLLFEDISADKGYSFSFTSGNHFFIIAQDKKSEEYYLVLHSSANEFKRSYMGLYPVEDNWYSKKVKTVFDSQNRYFRYLKDAEARHFIKMAMNFRMYNEQIHHCLAERIDGRKLESSEFWMKHHYYMPTEQSIAIGTFAEPVGEEVPVFSAPGKPIYIFKIGEDNCKINIGGTKGTVCLVPHGWGQKIDDIKDVAVKENKLVLSIGSTAKSFDINSKSHIDCKEKMLRDFEDGHDFLEIGKNYVKGSIIKELIPCFEYSQKYGTGRVIC